MSIQTPQSIIMRMLRDAINVQLVFYLDAAKKKYRVEVGIDGGEPFILATDAFKVRKLKNVDDAVSIIRRAACSLQSLQIVVPDVSEFNRKPPSLAEKAASVARWQTWAVEVVTQKNKLMADAEKITAEWQNGENKTKRLAAIAAEIDAINAVIHLAAGMLPNGQPDGDATPVIPPKGK
ncbi:hypothetical protein LPB67_15435 [Undibacterium sp. Jales W-56]|uniref:hypothetical protein n=1 Tax=Undibacterium sp. Jales W-56 TaxID=2897325 RepID=UPI0021CFB62A|nr:hypothetical protein [Undibacterium sp. Jales W-56]MCU6435169.1 hypothetical protein [Undibacterium sp. Jales W-56]